MRNFKEIDVQLSGQFSVDYWEDDRIVYAGQLVSNFDVDDWRELGLVWRTKSVQWQRRCAQVLPWGNAEDAASILLAMIEEPDDELAIAAIDSLRGLEKNLRDLTISLHARGRIERIKKYTSTLNAQVIDDFLARIDKQ